MQTMHTATEPSEKPVQDAGVNMNLFKEGGRRPPALPPSMAGGDNANSNTETITMEFVVDPSVYRSANYQPTPKMLAALKKRGTKHKSQKTEEETTVDKKPTTAERDNGGNALSAIDIMIERLKREEQRPTPLNPHPKKWAYKKRPQRGVPKGGTEKPTIDESPGEGLQKHDERFHDGHYDGGECKYRENRGIPLESTPPPTSSAQQSAASQPSASEVAREDTIAVGHTDESASVVSPTEAPTAVPSPAENSQAAQKTPQNAIAAPIPAVPHAQAQSASSPVESPEKVYEGIPKKKVVEYKRRMEKSRPYLDADQILSELSKIKDKKIQSDAFEWVLKGAVRLPEDMYKVQRAREMATKGKVDPLSYETPEACIADLYDSGMRDSVKPISVEELKQNPLMSNYRNHGYGIETFEVQDDEDGQALMRKVIDTHWGQDASPWCLLQGKDVYWASCFGDECGDEGGDPDVLDEDERAENRASAEKWWKRLGEQGRLDFLRQHNEPSAKDITKKLFRDEELQEFAKGKIWDAPYAAEYFAKNKIMPYDERFSGVSDDAWGYWERYSALPKRVAFKDGKLLAFMGTDGYDSVDEALRDFTSAELAGRLPMLYDEYISQVRNAIEEGDEEKAEEVREKYGEDEDEWIEHFDEWMEDSNNWWGYEDEEEILRELTPEEWWDRQDSPHKGIPMGLTTLSDSEKKKLRDTIIKRAQMNGDSLSPDELEVGKGFSRDAELMPSGTVEWSGDYIRGRDGRPGYMRLDSRGQLKEDIQADGTRRRFDFDFIKGTYLHDTVSKSPDGTETTTEYFPGGEKKSETITAPGKTAEERNWDVEGRLIYEHASGRKRRWDGATGNLIQDVDAIGIGHEWTPDGVMTYEHLPNGDMMQWDSKGNKVFERKNTPGCLMSASWNPRQLGGGLDRIAKRYNDGTSEEWEWYPGGELKSYRGKDGKLKEWSSTGRQLEFSLGEHTDDKGNKAEWGAKTLRIDPSYMDLDASVTLADGNEALLRNETRPRVGGMGEKGHLYTKNGTISWFTGDRLDVLDVIGDYHGKKFFGAFTHDSLTPIAARCSENFPMEEARHWIGETWKAKERAQKFNEPDPYAKEHSLPQGKNAEMPEWVGFPKDEKNTDSLNAPKAPGAKEAAAIVGDEAPTKSALMMAFDELPEEGLQKHDERFHGGHYDGGECKYRTGRGIPTAEPTSNHKPQEESAEQIEEVDTIAEQKPTTGGWSKRLRTMAQAAAKMIERFMPGVKVRLSDAPYEEGGGDERKSISGIFTGSAADYANRSRHGGVADGPSLLKVGTGEGSCVFGWGLYGSNKRGVADSYAAMAVGNKDKGVGYSKNGRVLHSEGDGVEGDAATLLALYGDIETAIKEAPAFPNGDAIVKELEEHGSEYKEYKPNEIVYEQTFFTNREQGDDSHLLMWQEPIGLKRLKAITEALPFEKQRIFRSWVRGSLPYGNKPQHAWGGDVYEALANTLDGYKSASEFLRDKLDYDGVKVPVGTFNSLHKQDGDEVGWNYVSFRDNNISVDHKWVDGEMRYFKGDGGKVVGTYNRRTGEVVLYPGADKNTIAHELGGHATWQYAEQLAKEGNDKLLNKMNQVVDAAPSNIKDEVAKNYGKEANAVQREEIWAHVMGHRGSAAIQKALESKRGRSWWGRFWDTAKEAWRGLASKVGLNRTSLDNIDQMSPDEFADYMAKEMVSGKVLGNIKYDKSDNSSSDDKRKQIVGTRGARKLGIGNQSDAQQMESDGASREDIWRKTGWWKGQDGQWRIEIADIPDVFKPLSQKEATRLKALKAAEKKEDAAVKDAIKKYKAARDSGNADEANKYADEAERHEAASLKHSQARYPLEARSKGWTEDILGNLLADHPLLKAYPWLSQTKVNRVSLPKGIGGHTDSSKNVITLSDTNTDAENHSALAHEIQHLIQSVEGFAKGADPDKVGMSNYLQHGGEVESRNVEKRLTMSPEERAATPPWETEDVAESEQIVRQE